MKNYKTGDKFIIELGSEFEDRFTKSKIFKIKGTETLYVYDSQLDKLERCEEKKDD